MLVQRQEQCRVSGARITVTPNICGPYLNKFPSVNRWGSPDSMNNLTDCSVCRYNWNSVRVLRIQSGTARRSFVTRSAYVLFLGRLPLITTINARADLFLFIPAIIRQQPLWGWDPVLPDRPVSPLAVVSGSSFMYHH